MINHNLYFKNEVHNTADLIRNLDLVFLEKRNDLYGTACTVRLVRYGLYGTTYTVRLIAYDSYGMSHASTLLC